MMKVFWIIARYVQSQAHPHVPLFFILDSGETELAGIYEILANHQEMINAEGARVFVFNTDRQLDDFLDRSATTGRLQAVAR